ncbi:MAG: phage terminase large subunit [Bacteroidales bacterium]
MRITLHPTLKQHEAWEALKTSREVFFGGGAGGGKTWWLCETRLVNCYLYPGYKSFIGREELKRLMGSTFITWAKVCKFHNIPETEWKLNGQYNYIEFKNGSRIDLLDLKYAPSDPLYERFGSLEYTDGAIEECGEIHFLAYDVLKSRIGRHMNDQFGLKPTLAMTGNPKKNWTYRDFYKPFSNGTLSNDIKFIQSLYYDNKFTSKDYKEQLNNIKDRSTKERLMFGNWDYDSDPTSMIDYDRISNIWTNSHVQSGTKCIISDVARYGSDDAIVTAWDGFKLVEYKTFAISSTVEIQNCINAFRSKHQVSAKNTIVDDDGVGGGVVDNCHATGFVNNSKALDTAYQNLKTECGYKLAELIDKIYIACEMPSTVKDRIEQELGQLKTYESDKDGKLRILPKEKIKENLGRSPDWLDVFIMRMYPEIKPTYKGAKYHF